MSDDAELVAMSRHEENKRLNSIRTTLRMRGTLSADQIRERWRCDGTTADDLRRVAAYNTQDADAIATIRMQLVRNDLLNADLYSPTELHARWQGLGCTSSELTKARRTASAEIHPDRHPGDAAAADRLARANAAVDTALAALRLDDTNNTNEAAIR